MELLGYDKEKDKEIYENLSAGGKRGLNKLRKRVKNKEIIICQTDKSGRFAVLTYEQYIKAGNAHTVKDREINLDEAEEIQRILNGHMRHWSKILNLGAEWDQEDRSLRNLLSNGLAVCPMVVLIKDHKSWTIDSEEALPSRSVMNGNMGMNSPISEFISMVMEPIANEDKNNMEINSTDGLIADIKKTNKTEDRRMERDNVPDGWISEAEAEGPTDLKNPAGSNR